MVCCRNRTFFSLLAMAVLPAATQASLVATDNFESYTAGVQFESSTGVQLNGGTGFTGPYNANDTYRSFAKVTSANLSYNSGAISLRGGSLALGITGDVSVVNKLLARPFPSQTGTVYFSFLYRTTNPANDEDFIQIGMSNVEADEPNVSIGTGGGTGSSPFFVRVPTGTGGNLSSTTTFLQPNTTYLMVGKISKSVSPGNYNQVTLYVNPSTLTEPSSPLLTRTADSTISSASYFIVRSARLDSGDVYLMDNVQIGTTYADVVPEPAMVSFISLAGGLSLLARRRSHKTA